ncbi:MAG: chloride channel protein, partial [Myxococcales bacterium]|nr:chloride channel protein [Myxococcales bacterium]
MPSERSDDSPAVVERRSKTARLVAFSALLGVCGAGVALLFDGLVDFAQRWLLTGIAGYSDIGVEQAHRAGSWPDLGRHWWIPVATTVGGLLTGIVVYGLAPEAEGGGEGEVVRSYHQDGGNVRARIPFVKAVASAITIGSGGAAGREGPMALISAGVGSIIAKLARVSVEERRQLMLIGTAAGVSAVFQSPLGSAIFTVEVLYSGVGFEGVVLLYTLIASAVAYALHGMVVGFEPMFLLQGDATFKHPFELGAFAVLGVLAGVLGALLPLVLYGVRDGFRRMPIPNVLKPALGGLLLGVVGVFLPELLGSGYGFMQLAIDGAPGIGVGMLCFLALGKIVALSLTAGSGGSGGMFGPSLYVGALLGAVVAATLHRFNLGGNTAALAVVGMAAVFGAAGRVPIANLVMVTEMTGGYALIMPTMVAVSLAYLTQALLTRGQRYRTLYDAQVANASQSPAHQEEYYRTAAQLLRKRQVRLEEDILRREFVEALSRGEPIPLGAGNEELFGIEVEAGSSLDGVALKDLREDVVVVSVVRAASEQIP